MRRFWVKMSSSTRTLIQSVHSRAVKVDVRRGTVYLEIRTTDRGKDVKNTIQLSSGAALELAEHLIAEVHRLGVDPP